MEYQLTGFPAPLDYGFLMFLMFVAWLLSSFIAFVHLWQNTSNIVGAKIVVTFIFAVGLVVFPCFMLTFLNLSPSAAVNHLGNVPVGVYNIIAIGNEDNSKLIPSTSLVVNDKKYETRYFVATGKEREAISYEKSSSDKLRRLVVRGTNNCKKITVMLPQAEIDSLTPKNIPKKE
jgi:hypothetical protein